MDPTLDRRLAAMHQNIVAKIEFEIGAREGSESTLEHWLAAREAAASR
jgi:hypothetical protein